MCLFTTGATHNHELDLLNIFKMDKITDMKKLIREGNFYNREVVSRAKGVPIHKKLDVLIPFKGKEISKF